MNKVKYLLSYRYAEIIHDLTMVIGLIIGMCFIYRFVERDSLMHVINQSLPSREAGILGGIMLGDRSGFDKDFYKYLQNSGLVHLVIVSGSNVMLLVGGLIESLAAVLGRKRIIIAGMIIGWRYAAMVGWEVPVVRAMLMLSIMYWAQLLGRKFDIGRGLALAILIMVVGEVAILTSVSFWLSIMAFMGVVTSRQIVIPNKNFLTVSVVAHAQRSKILLEMTKVFISTIWVSLWITPILAMVFGQISLISPLTNMLVLGVVEVITIIGATGAVVGLVVPILGKTILWLVYPLLKYFALVTGWGGSSGWATMTVNFNWMILIGWYMILFYFLMKNKINNNQCLITNDQNKSNFVN